MSKKGDEMLVIEHKVSEKQFPVREYILLNHQGFAQHKAHNWWKERAMGEPPASVEDALERLDDIRPIKELELIQEGDFDRVDSVVFIGNIGNIEKESLESDEIPF